MTVQLVAYRGISFPFRKGPTSFPEGATDEVLIKDAVYQLVRTMKRERVMRPEFGAKSLASVFENNDEVLSNLLRADIQGLIVKYEPRIRVLDVQVERKASEVILTIVYTNLATGRSNSVTLMLPAT